MGEWLGTKEAAEVWTRATGQKVTPARLRYWCRSKPEYLDGIEVFHMGDRYFIDRKSMLDEFEARALRALAVVKEERDK